MLKKLLVKVVDYCARHPFAVLVLALIVAAASGAVVAERFAINTDINKLISDDLDWRQRELALGRAFPRQDLLTIAVIDAPTPELAQDAAHRLTAKLQKQTDTV